MCKTIKLWNKDLYDKNDRLLFCVRVISADIKSKKRRQ